MDHWTQVLSTHWGIDAQLRRLDGEYDLNFLAETAAGGRPEIVSLGAQKNFANFAHTIGKEWDKQDEAFSEEWFRNVISKLIIFRKTERIVSDAASSWYTGGLRANTVCYSWESDVVLDFQFSPALSLFATTTRRQTIRAEFVTFRDGLSQGLRRICALDYKYIGHHEKLFDRQKPMSIIATPGGSEPFVRASPMLKKAKTLGHFQTAPLPTEQYNTLCGVKSFFGKVVARLVFHWFAYRTKRISGSRKVVYEAFMDVLTNTLDVTSGGRPRNDYYANAIARL